MTPARHPRHGAVRGADLGEDGGQLAELLGVRLGGADRHRGRHPLAEPLLDRLAIPLAERRSLALPVVGDDDDSIRPWASLDELLEPAEGTIDALERVERFAPLGA